MSNVYFISDLHIGHTNVHLKWRKEFKSQEHHDFFMIDAWNSVVQKRDVVKVLGDFIIGLDNLWMITGLNGTIHWILGNHDPKITREILNQYPNISYVGGIQKYKGHFLSHAPIHPQELEYRNVGLNIHGHVHHKEHNNLGDKYYNVCADIIGYYPIPFNRILKERGYE